MLGDSRRQRPCTRCSLASSFWSLGVQECARSSQGSLHVLVAYVRRAVMHCRVRACALQRAIPKLALERQQRTPTCMGASYACRKKLHILRKVGYFGPIQGRGFALRRAAHRRQLGTRSLCRRSTRCSLLCSCSGRSLQQPVVTALRLVCSTLRLGCAQPKVRYSHRTAGFPQVAEQGLPGSLRHSVALSLQTSSLGCIMPSTRGETGSTQSLQPALSV